MFGPILRRELTTAARSGAPCRSRAALGAMLLAVLAIRYLRFAEDYPGGAPIGEVAGFARWSAHSVLFWVGAGVAGLAPLLAAGAIAGERRRGTLRDLLTTPLTGPGIVAGKLAARLLGVGSMALVALPVLALLALFGGVDVPMTALVLAGIATTGMFLGSLSMAISVHSRGPREAVLGAISAAVLWISVPWIYSLAAPAGPLGRWLDPPMGWLLKSSPAVFLQMSVVGAWPALGLRALGASAPTMIGLQLAGSAALIALAGARLRPVERSGRFDRPARPRSRRPGRRSAVGDDPMLWKERHALGGAAMPRLAVAALTLLLVAAFAILFLDSILVNVEPALEEFRAHGYGIGPRGEFAVRRSWFNNRVGNLVACLCGLACVTVTATAATSVTVERERDTLAALRLTMLGPREILRAKMLGSIWRVRGLVGLIVLIWLGLAAIWALHPVGLALGLAGLAGLLWFAAALGVGCSVGATSTNRALAWALAILVGLNASGYLVLRTFLDIPGEYWLITNGPAMLTYLTRPPGVFLAATRLMAAWESALLLLVPGIPILAYVALGAILARRAARRLEAAEG